MTVRAGVDLNGYWDWAALDGLRERGADVSAAASVNDGGINGAVIHLLESGEFVGGPQNALAPHGRGPGWGEHLGHHDRRKPVRDLLAIAQGRQCARGGEHENEFRALFGALAPDADEAVVAVPDTQIFDEAQQQAYLEALRGAGPLRVSLLWRPIATMLGWLEAGAEGLEDKLWDGIPIATISLMGDSVQVADARLLRRPGRRALLWAPERRRRGFALSGPYAGKAVVDLYAEQLSRKIGLAKEKVVERMMGPWRQAMGRVGAEEVVRLDNRSWRSLPTELPEIALPELPKPETEALERVRDAEVVLLDGPFVENTAWRWHVLAAFGIAGDDPRLRIADPATAARGCREAGRRLSAGDPPYFDFLPQLEINALVDGRQDFVDLIPHGAEVQGGRQYVGRAEADFAINSGASQLTFYLIKEDFDWPRKAVHELPETPDLQHRIDVTVRQTPGQGFARVEISSETYEPFRDAALVLDWNSMETIEKTRKEVLDEAGDVGPDGYPDVQVVPAHPVHWHPDHPRRNLKALLDCYAGSDLFREGQIVAEARRALSDLAQTVPRRQSPRHIASEIGFAYDDFAAYPFVDADGRLPESLPGFPVPEGAEAALDAALRKAERDLGDITSKPATVDNQDLVRDIVMFATWCQTRCPNGVVRFLLGCMEQREAFQLHHKLIVEGLGRSLRREDDLKRFFGFVQDRLNRTGHLNDRHFAALGMTLGRRSHAAGCLTHEQALAFMMEADRLYVAENKKPRDDAYKKLFKYGLLMLAVLLRYRSVRPDFLVPGPNTLAAGVIGHLETAKERIDGFRRAFEAKVRRERNRQTAHHYHAAARRLERHHGIVEELLGFIRMEGGNPNIIQLIEDLD